MLDFTVGLCPSSLLRAAARQAAVASLLFLLVIVSAMASMAQTNSIGCQSLAVARVTADIDDGLRATLRGNVHRLALPQYDQGRVDDSMLLEHIIMMLQRTPEQDQALTTRIDQMHNSRSPLYHQWLRATDVGNCYGVADSDIAKVTEWLQRYGFQVDTVPAGKMLIMFTGTAGQVREAFQTEIHNLNVKGENHIANMSEPTIPAALAPVVAGFRSLHNFFPKPLYRLGGLVQRDPETRRWKRVSETASAGMSQGAAAPSPEATYSGTRDFYLVGPQDLYTIYNENPLLTASTPINGAGQTLAIVQDSEVLPADVTAFRSQFGLPTYPTTPNATQGGVDYMFGINGYCSDPGAPTKGDAEGEADLDTEWIGATAPAATIDLVVCADGATTFGGDQSATYIINNLDSTVSAFSASFGWCESDMSHAGLSQPSFYNTLWQQAVAEGQTPVVASGDSGDDACDRNNQQGFPSPFGGFEAIGLSGFSVNGMGSSPYNVSTGGTMFTDWYQQHTNPTTYWNTNDTSPYGSALSYIPETTWNDYCGTPIFDDDWRAWAGMPVSDDNPFYVCNNVGQSFNNVFYLDYTDLGGGGGGTSIDFALPTWQSAYGVGLSSNYTSTLMRNLPDVSLFAATGWFWNEALAFCESDLGACDFAGSSPVMSAGGTSFVAPMVAGIIGLINQAWPSGNAQPTRQGQANYTLYALATAEYGTASSQNTSTTAPSTYTCEGSNINAISTYSSIFPSCTFYNINRTNQVGSTSCLGSNNTGCLVGTNDQVCQAGSTECYTTSQSNNGAGMISISPSTFEPAYPNSAGFNDANGLGSFNIANLVNNWTKVTPLFASTTAAAANPTSLTSGTATTILTATVTATGRGGVAPPLGTVTFYESTACSGTTIGTANLVPATVCTVSCNSVATLSTVTGDQLGNGTDNVIACFSGDGANDAPSTSSAVTVTVTGATFPTTTGISLSSSTIGIGSTTPITLSATVTQSTGSATPTGTVTFFNGTTQLGTPATLNSSATATYSYNASSLAVGSYSITASYSGDSNYSPSTSPVGTLTVSPLIPTTITQTVTGTPSSSVVNVGSQVTLSATVAHSSGSATPTGTVTFANGSTTLGTGTLNSSGTATFNSSTLATGSYSVVASYSGDANYAVSTSAAAAFSVVDFTIAASPTTVTVSAPGQTGTTTLTVSPISGFNETLSYSCTGLPAQSTCTFATASATTETLTINTTAASSRMAGNRSGRSLSMLYGLLLPGFLGLMMLGGTRKRTRLVLFILALTLLTLWLPACGGSSNSGGGGGGGNSGTPAGTSTVTITASTGSGTGALSHTTQITLTVQ